MDLELIYRDRPQIAYDTTETVFRLFETGALSRAMPITTFRIGDVESAFRMIAARKHIGKLVLVADDTSECVKALPRPPKPLQLSPQGTYVVVGGLGDLGRVACALLARSRAGHIVTLSRNLPADVDLEAFRSTIAIQSNGTCLLHTFTCDVTDRTAVLRVAASLRDSKPPVRGVIHCGLALSVSHERRKKKHFDMTIEFIQAAS